jgi:pilus assembly protein CpaD
MTDKGSTGGRRALRLAGTLLGLSVALGGCNSTSGEVVTASVPEDYRLRHPIAVEEGKQSMVVFVGQGRGGLSATQRADVAGLARSWMREGTGAIVADERTVAFERYRKGEATTTSYPEADKAKLSDTGK